MEREEIRKHIDAIIANTFVALKDVYDHQKEDDGERIHVSKYSRILFPRYSKGETRLSEQELRFIFVEKFNQYCTSHNIEWFYSVETPTKYKYKFSDNGSKIEPIRDDENGQSAMVDMAIHDETYKRIALIEFKALNPNASCFAKDFVKLENEPNVLTFFIMYVKSYDRGTLNSLRPKVSKKGENTIYLCYDLESGKTIQNEM